MKKIEVVAGIIQKDNKILCMQRDKGKYNYTSYKWEFPGGKIEQGETKEMALKRELLEEMNMNIFSLKHFVDICHTYPDFEINMYCFLCETNDEKISLNVHKDYRWCKIEELKELDFADADKPVVEKILNTF